MKPPDPRKSFQVFVSGQKGKGKSHYCRAWFDAYPFDKLVIDPTGDVTDDLRRDGAEFTRLDADVLPVRFPSSLDEDRYVTCAYVPDMGSATAVDDMDRAAGLLLRGRDQRGMLWVDEFGALTRGGKTPPNTRRMLHHGRHHNLSLLLATPRPQDVDVLGIGNADLVITYRTVQVYDIQRIADTIGYPRDELAAINREHCQGHAYTAYDCAEDQLYLMPPLPPRRAGRNLYPPVPE